ncbi:hypothetical protein ACROYT_G017695 [Oculina patagonica]
MFLLKVLAFAFVMAFVFGNAETRYLDSRFKGMIIEKSFDEASGRCRYFDRLYEEGQSMVPDEGCQYQCTCHVSKYYEGFLCEPLCPQYIDLQCRPGWENKPQMVPVGPPDSRTVAIGSGHAV